MNHSLSVIISTFKRKEYVNQLLISISNQTILPNEIIIVDSSNENISYDYPAGLNIKKVSSEIRTAYLSKKPWSSEYNM